MSSNLKKLRPYDEPRQPGAALVPSSPDSAAVLWLATAVVWLVAATGIGLIWMAQIIFPTVTLQLHFAGPIHLWVVVDPTRTLAGFQNALVFGWLTNAAIGAIWFIAPRLTGRPISNLGANVALGLWNLAVILGVASLYTGILPGTGMLSQFPAPIAALALLAVLMVNGIFWSSVAPALRAGVYVSLLYFGVALLALLGLLVIPVVVPVLNLDPVPAALVNAFYSRDLQFLWLLGTAVGTLYYVVPRTSGNLLYSSGLALLGWVAWAGLAALSGLGGLLDPSVPFALTSLGQTATMLLVLPALLVVANLLLTMQGRWALLLRPGTLAFAAVALAFLMTSPIIDAVGSLRAVQAQLAPTMWGSGAFVFAALGLYSFAFFALADHAFPRALRRSWGETPLTSGQLWATWIGTTLAGAALMFGGIAQGSLLAQATGPQAIDATMIWFRMVAVAGIGLTALGSLGLLGNLFLMYTEAAPADVTVPSVSPSATAAQGELSA